MQIDFNQKIMNAKGDGPLPKFVLCANCQRSFPESQKDNEFTLGDVASDALFTPEQGVVGEEAAKRGALAIEIVRSKEPLNLTVEQVALIKKRIGETKTPLVITQAWGMLEGNREE